MEQFWFQNVKIAFRTENQNTSFEFTIKIYLKNNKHTGRKTSSKSVQVSLSSENTDRVNIMNPSFLVRFLCSIVVRAVDSHTGVPGSNPARSIYFFKNS